MTRLSPWLTVFMATKIMVMAFAELLNHEPLAFQADGVDVTKFDKSAYDIYVSGTADWGVQTL